MESAYPSHEQWASLQGGEPLVLANEPSTLFELIHVYDNHYDGFLPSYDANLAERVGHYGRVIDTPALQMNASVREPAELLLGRDLRHVKVPAALLISLHGNPCSGRSGPGTSSEYRTINDETDWGAYLQERAGQDCDVWQVVTEGEKQRLELRGMLKDII